MKKEKTIKTLGTLLFIGLVLAACGGVAPTATLAVSTPTAPPQPTAIPTPALPAMKIYKDLSNSFSISVPVDWTLEEGYGYGNVILNSPDQNAYVNLLAVNTVIALNADAFTKIINAFELNIFSRNKNYAETKREVQADKGYAIITKTLDINTVPFQISTQYEQKGKVLYVESYYSAVSSASQYGPILNAMDNSFKSNPAYAEDLSPFTSAPFIYTDPDNLYSLFIPSLWTFTDANKDGRVIAYTSPDDYAIIMLVKYDLGKAVTRALADSNALKILKGIASDSLVSKTETLKNGSIQKTWASKSAGLQGVSIYKWSGTTWFFISWVHNTALKKSYGPVVDQSIASYKIPN